MKKIFAANWKLFKSPDETREYFASLLKVNQTATGELVFFPSAVCLEAASKALSDSTVRWGAQSCHSQVEGAFTGENSMAITKKMGASYVLVGHSERRSLFGENDAIVAEKVALAQSLDLTPMLCIGETLEERNSKSTYRVLQTQLHLGLSKAERSQPLVVAYEPVWAIGTGQVATPEQVAETHTDIFNILKELSFESTPILYGGSVKPDNAAGLIVQPHVSGFLVGGASLQVDSFQKIFSV